MLYLIVQIIRPGVGRTLLRYVNLSIPKLQFPYVVIGIFRLLGQVIYVLS